MWCVQVRYNVLIASNNQTHPIMPDISMCTNADCPLSWNCWRFNAPPTPYWQAYADFAPDENGECEYYWPQDQEIRFIGHDKIEYENKPNPPQGNGDDISQQATGSKHMGSLFKMLTSPSKSLVSRSAR